jgi:hypothetical protein
METLLRQLRQKLANGLDGNTDIGAMLQSPAIVQAENRAPSRATEQAGDDSGRLPFPV